MADASTIGKFMTLLSDNFRGELSKEMTEFITEMLAKFTNEQLDNGLQHLLYTRKYNGFPKIAEIIEAVNGGSQQDKLRLEAEQEFNKALWMAHDVYGQPEPVRLAQMNSIGRHVFRMMGNCSKFWTDNQIDFKRRDFVDMYMRLAISPERVKEITYANQERWLRLVGDKPANA